MWLISQRFGCLTYVGEIQTIGTGQIGVVSMTYHNFRCSHLNHYITNIENQNEMNAINCLRFAYTFFKRTDFTTAFAVFCPK